MSLRTELKSNVSDATETHFLVRISYSGFPGGTSGKEAACQCRRHKSCRFDPWVGKLSWRRKWQPTSVSLPGESHGQRSLVGYGPCGHKLNNNNNISIPESFYHNHFEVDSLVVLRTLTLLCNHPHHPFPVVPLSCKTENL